MCSHLLRQARVVVVCPRNRNSPAPSPKNSLCANKRVDMTCLVLQYIRTTSRSTEIAGLFVCLTAYSCMPVRLPVAGLCLFFLFLMSEFRFHYVLCVCSAEWLCICSESSRGRWVGLAFIWGAFALRLSWGRESERDVDVCSTGQTSIIKNRLRMLIYTRTVSACTRVYTYVLGRCASALKLSYKDLTVPGWIYSLPSLKT